MSSRCASNPIGMTASHNVGYYTLEKAPVRSQCHLQVDQTTVFLFVRSVSFTSVTPISDTCTVIEVKAPGKSGLLRTIFEVIKIQFQNRSCNFRWKMVCVVRCGCHLSIRSIMDALALEILARDGKKLRRLCVRNTRPFHSPIDGFSLKSRRARNESESERKAVHSALQLDFDNIVGCNSEKIINSWKTSKKFDFSGIQCEMPASPLTQPVVTVAYSITCNVPSCVASETQGCIRKMNHSMKCTAE